MKPDAEFDAKVAASEKALDEAQAAAKAHLEAREPSTTPVVDGLPQEPRAPSADELNHSRIRSSTEGLAILRANNEEQWIARELQKARTVRTAARGPERAAANRRVRDLEHAQQVIAFSRKGAKGPYITVKNERSFVRSVLSLVGERAKESIAGRMISPYLVNAAGAEVEQGRSLRRLLMNSSSDSTGIESKVRKVGEVSATYAKHGDAIEAHLGQLVPKSVMEGRGIYINAEITGTQLLTEMDEFANVVGHQQFGDLVQAVSERADTYLRGIDPDYGIERWLDDRLVHGRDGYLDSRTFEEADRRIVAAKEAITEGAKRQTRTDLRRAPGKLPGSPVSEMVDVDIQIIAAKAKVLSEMRINPHAYNEARRVLRPSMLKKKYGLQLAQHARSEAEMALRKAGMHEFDAGYKEAFQKAYDDAFLAKRAEMAEEESQKLLEQLAKEMIGASNIEIIEEFERRYGLDNVVKGHGGENHPVPAQDAGDGGQDPSRCGRHQRPGADHGGAVTPWAGAAVPRPRGDARVAGQVRLLVAAHRRDGRGGQEVVEHPRGVPVLHATRGAASPTGRTRNCWRSAVRCAICSTTRTPGLTSTASGACSTGTWRPASPPAKMSRIERARFLVEGSVELGVKAKRDPEMERKYVIERFGKLANESGDGETLTAFPELMNRDELKTYISKATKDGIPLPRTWCRRSRNSMSSTT